MLIWTDWSNVVMEKESLWNKLRIQQKHTIIIICNTKQYKTYEPEWKQIGTAADASSGPAIKWKWTAKCSDMMLGWVTRRAENVVQLELLWRWAAWQTDEYATTEAGAPHQELPWDNSPSIMCSLLMRSWDMNHIIWILCNRIMNEHEVLRAINTLIKYINDGDAEETPRVMNGLMELRDLL